MKVLTTRKIYGGFCLVCGCGLIGWSVATARDALTMSGHGLPLLNLIGVGLGLAAVGASADLFGFTRRTSAKETNGIANSVWANLDHLEKYDVVEK